MKYNLHHKNIIEMKNDKSIILTGSFITALSVMLISAFALLSCNGCRSGKVTNTINTTLSDKVSDSGLVVTQVDISQPSTSGNNDTNTYKQPYNISLLPADDSVVDEYNVRKYLLEFRSHEAHKAIKTIDLVKENPFHKMGLKRRKEPYPAVYYFLMPEGADTKNSLKKFLPIETFKEIPSDFEMDRAISKIFVSTTAGKYVTVSYELDWLPDAYSDQGEWDGPGYGVHHVVVYDSLGNKIYTRQFDGTSQMPSVSEDGKYLFTMACLSPEWDENIRYRFTVVNILTDMVVYGELIEKCKKNGGRGDYDDRGIKRNSYAIRLNNDLFKKFIYLNNSLYNQNRFMNIDNVFPISNDKLEVWYLDKPNKIIYIDSFFNEVKLD